MCLSIQQTLPLDICSQDKGIMIILAGRDLGLGALIQSTVNSIWLAKKLGKVPYIWWGKSCLYTNKLADGNTYSKFFQDSENYPALDLTGRTLVYPSIWNSFNIDDTLEELDKKAHSLELSQKFEFTLAERDLLVSSDLCIVYQYLRSDLAQLLAGTDEIDFCQDKFLNECSEIFSQYFQPLPTIQAAANKIWNDIFPTQNSVIGIHCRGTDKIFEKAVPSPIHYINYAKNITKQYKSSAFFIATDSLPALEQIQSKLSGLGIVGTQDIKRSDRELGLHFHPNGAFENGIEMIIDIELLCKCKVVIAFPGSQIFWWLSRKRDGGKIDFTLLQVKPNFFNWFFTIFFIFRTQGWTGLIQFLRLQKDGIKSLLKSFIMKNT